MSSDPRSSAVSLYCRPGRSEVIGGGVSRPTKARFSVFALPGSLPMYEPASRVESPETCPPAMRGRTTQKRVSSTRKPAAAWRSISAVTITDLRSCDNPTAFTVPTSTDLCLMRVFPASMPSPEMNWMVIVGPRSQNDLSAMAPATIAARIGTIHTNCTACERPRRSTACGTGSWSATAVVQGIPGEARVEAHRGEHGEHHDRGEVGRARARHDRGEGLELHQRHQRGADVDVHHRPAPDVRRGAVEARAPVRPVARAALRGEQQVGERQDLRRRDHDARHEHDDRKEPGARGPEEHHP